MNNDVRKLKDLLAAGALDAGISFGRFRREHPVDELLNEVIQPEDAPKQIAAKTIFTLCLEEGRYNRCSLALKAAFAFLASATDGGPQSLSDVRACHLALQQITSSHCTLAKLEKWVNDWY